MAARDIDYVLKDLVEALPKYFTTGTVVVPSYFDHNMQSLVIIYVLSFSNDETPDNCARLYGARVPCTVISVLTNEEKTFQQVTFAAELPLQDDIATINIALIDMDALVTENRRKDPHGYHDTWWSVELDGMDAAYGPEHSDEDASAGHSTVRMLIKLYGSQQRAMIKKAEAKDAEYYRDDGEDASDNEKSDE